MENVIDKIESGKNFSTSRQSAEHAKSQIKLALEAYDGNTSSEDNFSIYHGESSEEEDDEENEADFSERDRRGYVTDGGFVASDTDSSSGRSDISYHPNPRPFPQTPEGEKSTSGETRTTNYAVKENNSKQPVKIRENVTNTVSRGQTRRFRNKSANTVRMDLVDSGTN